MLPRWLALIVAATWCFSCQSIPKDFPATPSYALKETDDTFLGRRSRQLLHTQGENSGFYPLVAGPDALLARLASALEAKKSLDLQYYIWHDDLVGKIMLSAVLEAADRGVRVRLLLDDLNIGQYEEGLLVLDTHPNIEVRMFNPFAHRGFRALDFTRFDQVNRRMHNKSMIADNQVAIVGGRNIGNEYFSASDEMNFGDFDVWAIGPVVKDISTSFDVYWNNALSVPISVLNPGKVTDGDRSNLRHQLSEFKKNVYKSPYASVFRDSALLQKFRQGNVRLIFGKGEVVYDNPDKFNGTSQPHKTILGQSSVAKTPVQKEMFLVSPYFIPGKSGMEFFRQQEERGVEVKVLTNSLAANDVSAVFSGYKPYRKDLVELGVEIFELKPRQVPGGSKRRFLASSGSRMGLHAKVYVFDRESVFVGSMNLDPRSLDLNSEMGVVIHSPEFAQSIVTNLNDELADIAYKLSVKEDTKKLEWTTKENGQTVQYKSEPEVGFWKKAAAWFYSIFVPESLL